eukprot:1196335-Prorocentrum_minimum.AAC.2
MYRACRTRCAPRLAGEVTSYSFFSVFMNPTPPKTLKLGPAQENRLLGGSRHSSQTFIRVSRIIAGPFLPCKRPQRRWGVVRAHPRPYWHSENKVPVRAFGISWHKSPIRMTRLFAKSRPHSYAFPRLVQRGTQEHSAGNANHVYQPTAECSYPPHCTSRGNA